MSKNAQEALKKDEQNPEKTKCQEQVITADFRIVLKDCVFVEICQDGSKTVMGTPLKDHEEQENERAWASFAEKMMIYLSSEANNKIDQMALRTQLHNLIIKLQRRNLTHERVLESQSHENRDQVNSPEKLGGFFKFRNRLFMILVAREMYEEEYLDETPGDDYARSRVRVIIDVVDLTELQEMYVNAVRDWQKLLQEISTPLTSLILFFGAIPASLENGDIKKLQNRVNDPNFKNQIDTLINLIQELQASLDETIDPAVILMGYEEK